MPDESTPTCQRYLCDKATTYITGVVSKRGEVWVVSACDEHRPPLRTPENAEVELVQAAKDREPGAPLSESTKKRIKRRLRQAPWRLDKGEDEP